MTYISDVIGFLENIAPPDLQESYDNAGLITGDRTTEVKGILVSLDCTEAVVDEAISKGCNLIVSHHPILFKPIKRLTGEGYVERTLIKAIRNNIALYAIHTNLDSVMEGVNGKMANVLKLQNCRILQPKKEKLLKLVTFCPVDHAEQVRQALFEAGAGKIGNYDHCSFNMSGEGTFRGNEATQPFAGEKDKDHTEKEIRIETILYAHLEKSVLAALIKAHPYEEVAYDLYQLANHDQLHGLGMVGDLKEEVETTAFLSQLKKLFGTSVIRHTDLIKQSVKRIAVCGGSGSFLLEMAMREQADIFVTADVTYHRFFDADSKIILADIGHYESEHPTTQLLGDKLKEKFATFATHFSKVNTNPIKYF